MIRWARDLADDIDEVMVEHLVAGRRPNGFTSWERREAVRRLRDQGLVHREIAARIGVDRRQVSRDLTRIEREAA